MYVAASEKLYSFRIVLLRRLVLLVLSALHQRVAIFRENIFLLVSSFSAEIIQKEERIEILCVCRAGGWAKMDSRTFEYSLSLQAGML